MYKLRNTGGRIAAPRKGISEGEESPGFKGTRYQITSGSQKVTAEFSSVRLKRRGKSSPHKQ